MSWLFDRLRERTTWLGVVAAAGRFGMNVHPELRETIINALIAVAAVVAFLFRENDREIRIEVSPAARAEPPVAEKDSA